MFDCTIERDDHGPGGPLLATGGLHASRRSAKIVILEYPACAPVPERGYRRPKGVRLRRLGRGRGRGGGRGVRLS